MFKVMPYGNDCMGNITGHQVQKEGRALVLFPGNLYMPGSFPKALEEAKALCEQLNLKEVA